MQETIPPLTHVHIQPIQIVARRVPLPRRPPLAVRAARIAPLTAWLAIAASLLILLTNL